MGRVDGAEAAGALRHRRERVRVQLLWQAL